jgi:hypothetical protein
MMSTPTMQDLNRELARQINAEALANPNSPYSGKFVGIANGQVVIVADTLDEVARKLRLTEHEPAKAFSFEASRDYSVVEEI